MDYYILTPLFFVLRIMESFVHFSLVLSISNSKVKFTKFLLGTFILTILFEVSRIKVPQYLISILTAVLAISISTLMFKINIKKSIFSYLITAIIVAIVDCIVCTSIVKFTNLQSFEELTKSNLFLGIAKVLVSLISFFISLLIKSRRKDSTSTKTENIKNTIIMVSAIITFFLLLPNLVMILYYHDNKALPLFIIIVNIGAIIATFLANIFSTQRGIRLIQTEDELVSEKLYNDTLKDLVDSLRTFKHDTDNTLNTINGYIFTEDWDGLKIFIKDVIKETKTISALNKLKPELFNNTMLYGLVTAKFEYARKKEVTLNLEIYSSLDNLDIKTYDFTRTLGIFLDNAIEASAGSENKIVNFCVIERNNKITVDISNSFSDTGLQLDDIDKKGVSSKGENRGLGLYKVKDILNRYPKIKHETKAANGMFLQRLIIDKISLPVS